MKIAIGISGAVSAKEIEEYANAGVDEFFLGYLPDEWINRYGWELSINRRYTPTAQFRSKKELAEAVRIIHQNNCKVFLTLNDHEYTTAQFNLLLSILESIREIRFDAFIISNIGLMLELRRNGFEDSIHVSIGSGCNNVSAIQLYSENIDNIGRFVLPRNLTMDEFETIALWAGENAKKLEAFGMAACCDFNDEYCFTWHSSTNTVFCKSPMYHYREVQPLLFDNNWKEDIHSMNIETVFTRHNDYLTEIKQLRDEYYASLPARSSAPPGKRVLHLLANKIKCGLCSFKKFKELGVEAIKLPIRDQAFPVNLDLVQLSKRVLDETDANPQFCRNLLGETFFCSGPNCYYDYPYTR